MSISKYKFCFFYKSITFAKKYLFFYIFLCRKNEILFIWTLFILKYYIKVFFFFLFIIYFIYYISDFLYFPQSFMISFFFFPKEQLWWIIFIYFNDTLWFSYITYRYFNISFIFLEFFIILFFQNDLQ